MMRCPRQVKTRTAARRARPAAMLRRFLADNAGASAVLVGVMLPVLIGGLGLGAESGYWMARQRTVQHAADMAAHAAAVRLRSGASAAERTAAAETSAAGAGFDPGAGTLVVNVPPASGAFAGDANSVEVGLAETRRRLLSSIFISDPITLSGRAVAQVSGGSKGCVLALARSAPGAVTATGSAAVSLTGCDIASNSVAADSFLMSGSSTAVTSGCIFTVGEAVTTANLNLTRCPTVSEFAPVVKDPYANVAEPAMVGPCQNSSVGKNNQTTVLSPSDSHPSGVPSMRFCNGLDVKGQIQFGSGLYLIEGGDFTINGGDLSGTAGLDGSAVVFFLGSNARLRIGGNATFGLTAPTSGPYAGILFFGSRNGTGITHQITGTSASTMRGAVYAPVSGVEFTGNSTVSNGCTQIVARTITFTGNSTLQSDCTNAGTRDIVVDEIVRVVE